MALGASNSDNNTNVGDAKVQVMEGGYTYGVLAMDAYLWGGP